MELPFPFHFPFCFYLVYTFLSLPVSGVTRIQEIIRGPRLTWYGLPVNGGENKPLQPGYPLDLVLCWNYGRNKNIGNPEKFRFILKSINEDNEEIWEAKLHANFQPATYSIRSTIAKLPKDLSSCYQGSITIPAKLSLQENHEYQLYLMKYNHQDKWIRYSSILSLQMGSLVHLEKENKFVSILKSPLKNPQTMLAVGAGISAVYGALGAYPVMAVGLLVAAIAIYEILSGELIQWHGLPTEFSGIQLFSPLELSTIVACHRFSIRKQMRVANYEEISSPDFRFVLQQTVRGKPSIKLIPTQFTRAQEELKQSIPTLPNNLKHCYAASFQIPKNVFYHPDAPIEILLIKRKNNGQDKVFGSFQIKPGKSQSSRALLPNAQDIGKEASLAVGPALVVVGATHANFLMMGVGFAVIGLGLGILLSHVHPSTFLGKDITWHRIPPDTEEQEVEPWSANSRQQFILCQKSPKRMQGVSQFFYVLEEMSPKSISDEDAKIILATRAPMKHLSKDEWMEYPEGIKEDIKKAVNQQWCFHSEIQLPNVHFLSSKTYRLSLFGWKGGAVQVFDPLYFHARLKKRYRNTEVARTAAIALAGTGSYLLATGAISQDLVKVSIGLVALGVGVYLSHHKKHHAVEGVAHTTLETAVKGLLKAF